MSSSHDRSPPSQPQLTAVCLQTRILVIAESSQENLLILNTAIRRTTLLVRLGAPLLASVIITTLSYKTSVLVLLGNSIVSAAVEAWWISVIWNQFPALEHDELLRERRREQLAAEAATAAAQSEAQSAGMWQTVYGSCAHAKEAAIGAAHDWVEFAKMPVFLSELTACDLRHCEMLNLFRALRRLRRSLEPVPDDAQLRRDHGLVAQGRAGDF